MTPNSVKPLLLLVDDDVLITETLSFILSKEFEVYVVKSRPEAIELVRQLAVPPQLALVDLGLPPLPHRPEEGFQLVTELLAHSPEIKILILSGQNEESHARHARSLGAVDFIAKPCDPQDLKEHLFNALKTHKAEIDAKTAGESGDLGLIGISAPIEKMRNQIISYASAPYSVLIEGESGSGKELVAAQLHHLSKKSKEPFLALNCAAISPTLVEPTLFGYSKGAFTGATSAKSGYFEDAGEGALFLDEIGELPFDLQAKLLRVLENGEYQRVGETQTRKSYARVIAATNRDLRQEIHSNRFRSDLYHRLSVFTINVPALRELGEDRLLLLDFFRDFYATRGNSDPFNLDHEAAVRWQDYHFPGNVRELRNIIIRLSTKYAGQLVSLEQLEGELDTGKSNLRLVDSLIPEDPESQQELARKHLQSQRNFSLDQTLKEWEQSYVEAALKVTHGNVSQAAKLLGLNRTTLYSRMEAAGKEQD
ncbi:MAG: sigma-54-dependent transcriptional regulator [Nitrosomonadaceae bacterium]